MLSPNVVELGCGTKLVLCDIQVERAFSLAVLGKIFEAPCLMETLVSCFLIRRLTVELEYSFDIGSLICYGAVNETNALETCLGYVYLPGYGTCLACYDTVYTVKCILLDVGSGVLLVGDVIRSGYGYLFTCTKIRTVVIL